MTDSLPSSIPPEIRQVSAACLNNARKLLEGAQTLRDKNLHNLAFHLATLVLEEIGKSRLVGIRYLAELKDEGAWAGKHASDHVKKLFWAIWGPTIGRDLITKDQMDTFFGLAKHLHETRIRGLYSSADPGDFYVPEEAITADELDRLLALVENRLELEPSGWHERMDDETKKDFHFFMTKSEDPVWRRVIFSKQSMQRLVELGTPSKWIRWHREQFDQAAVVAQATAEKELSRDEPQRASAQEQKWSLKIRLVSKSHSVRPKPLNFFNDRLRWIRLYTVDGKKDQLLVEFTIPKQISIHALWWAGLGQARRFVTALNIGSMGFFWWYVPEQTSRYYETLTDLESNSTLVIARNPPLEIDWGKRALTEEDWNRIFLCFAMIPSPDKREEHPPFDHYVTALALISKTDIHLGFVPQAFREFFESLRSALRIDTKWNDSEEYGGVFKAVATEMIGNAEEVERLLALSERLMRDQPITEDDIKLEDVAELKLVCDAYFIRRFDRVAKARQRKN
jgi:AbiV family abortive infection protein